MALVGSKVSPEEVKDYADLRFRDLRDFEQLTRAMVAKLNFNGATRWGKDQQVWAEAILQEGKNPGLGVRALHAQGVTGKGVNVGIVDQNLAMGHPEYVGAIAEYKDVGCKTSADRGSMHGPAVASLLAGRTIGVAPGAKIYFAAAPSWTRDAQFQADGLNWILDRNEQLPAGNKIRVVSVSASPSGQGSPFTKNGEKWDEACARAQRVGVLVLDCTQTRGIIGPCYYDPAVPDDPARVTLGFPGRPFHPRADSLRLYAPCSGRTQAEEYKRGEAGYQYGARGGLSWSIPYAAGVLALGWELKPQLTAERMVALLQESAFVKDGHKIVNPSEFIARVRRER
jgi:hypothetical protein